MKYELHSGHSDEDSTIVPANIEAAFNASVHTSPSAKKKKHTTPAVDVSTRVLHTENIKTITFESYVYN